MKWAICCAFWVCYGWAQGAGKEFIEQAERAEGEGVQGERVVAGELVVRFKPRVERLRKETLLRSRASEVRYLDRVIRSKAWMRRAGEETVFEQLAVVRLLDAGQAGAVIKEWSRAPEIAYVEPNFRYRISEAKAGGAEVRPNDFDQGKLWGFENTGQSGGTSGADIRASGAWALGTGSRSTVVAIIDTGIDYFHPDLQENIWINAKEIAGNGVDDDLNGYIDDVHGYDFVSGDSDPMDDHTHGTHVAGTVGAVGNNQRGIAGVCWQVSLMAVKAFDELGEADVESIVEAIGYAAGNGARVINASWGGSSKSRALHEAIAEANRKGTLVVAALGNEKTDSYFYPAAYPEVMGVTASDHKDLRANFSNYGAYASVAAPGENIYSTMPNNHYDFLSGTSMAAPHVTGLAALIWSSHPEFKSDEVANIIRNTADELRTDKPIGAGRINARRAMEVQSPLPVADLELPSVLQGVVHVAGRAAGNRFDHYELWYGEGEHPERWVELHRSATAVERGVLLADWVTSDLKEGKYTIKLSVFNGQGQAASEKVLVSVRNVNISSPQPNDILRAGETIEIRGTVFGPGRDYTLEYGAGVEPVTWLKDGIELVENPVGKTVEGLLARWNTALLRTNEFYTLRLTSRVGGELVGESKVRLLYFDAQLKPGWPQYIPVTGEYPVEDWKHPVVADLDRDGFDEIIVMNHGNSDGHPAKLLVYRHTGRLWWSRELGSGEPYADIPTVGDVDRDGLMELFVDAGEAGQLFGFRHDGTAMGGQWPVTLSAKNLAKVIADLDGDGFAEVIGYSQDNEKSQQLLVINHLGTVLNQWTISACGRTNDVPKIFPAVGNIDEDPDLEIVTVTSCSAVSAFGMKKRSGPLWMASTDASLLLGSPVIGDLQNDGANEILIAGYSEGKYAQGGLYAWDGKGERLPGWPVLVDETFTATPALADFDGDGMLEISIVSSSSQKMYLLGAHGFPLEGWPVGPIERGHLNTSSVIGDVTGDGRPEVVVVAPGYWFLAAVHGDTSSLGGVRAWGMDGREIDLNGNRGITALLMEGSGGKSWLKSAPVALGDLDRNGKVDVVAVSIQDRAFAPLGEPSPRKQRSSVYVWELDAAYASGAMPWPMFQGNPQHTGAIQHPPEPNSPPVVADIPDQVIRAGSTFYAIELDRYVEDLDDFRRSMIWTVSGHAELRVTLDKDRVVHVIPPSATWTGKETLRFTAMDAAGAVSFDVATFEVRAEYDPPVARDDAVEVTEDMAVRLDVLANDADPDGDVLRVTHLSRPSLGTLTLTAAGMVEFVPKPDAVGADSFRYTISDGRGGMAIGLARITILPVNDLPVASVDLIITQEDALVMIDVLANDTDADGDVLQLAEFGKPEHGTITRGEGALLSYRPEKDFFGLDKFKYAIRDGSGGVGEGSVTVMVKPVNDVPLVTDQGFQMNRNAALNFEFTAADAEGDTLTYKVAKGPDHGVLMAYPAVATYTPNKGYSGKDSFTFVASDGQGESRAAEVSLEVLNANNAPEVEDQSLAVKVGRTLPVKLAAKDLDEDPLTFSILRGPEHGTLTGTAPDFRFKPEPGYLGADKLEYEASDGKSRSRTAVVMIKITDVNTAPEIKDSVLDVKMNTSTNLILRASDGEADELTYTVVASPLHGDLSGTGPEMVYTPHLDYVGSDRLKFKVNDGEAESGEATVTIHVKFPNTAPSVEDQSVVVQRDKPSTIILAATDLEGDTLYAPVLKGPQHGRLSGIGIRFQYVPKPGYIGGDSFTYKVWDGRTYSKLARVHINVTASVPEPNLQMISAQALANGQAQVIVRAVTGATYAIEASIDLIRWERVATKTAESETLSFIDTAAPGFAHRFYRAVRVD